MKNALLFLIVLLLVVVELHTQTTSHEICTTPDRSEDDMALLPWYGNNDTLPELAKAAMDAHDIAEYGNSKLMRDEKSFICDVESHVAIPIKFYFYYNVDNDPAMPNEMQLQRLMDDLNDDFQSNNILIRFYMLCPEYITKPEAVVIADNNGAYTDLFLDDNVPNAINVYVIEDLEGSGGAYFDNGDYIVVERDIYNTPTGPAVLAHELGHYFRLDHTHRNYDKDLCKQECVSRFLTFSSDWGCFSLQKLA